MTSLSLGRSPALERAAQKTIRSLQSDTAEILAEEPPFLARITLHVLVTLVATTLVLASVLPIDRVVAAKGRITSQAPKIVVQPLETSIVRKILAREGQIVKKGEVLAALDPTFSAADVSVLTRRIESLEAETLRIRAELAEQPFAAGELPGFGISAQLQSRIYDMRQSEYRSTLNSYDQKIGSILTARERAEKELDLFRQRLKLIGEVETMRTMLERQRNGTRLSTIAATDARVEIERNIAVQQGIRDGAEHDLEQMRSQRTAYVQKWLAETAEDLVTKQRLLDQAREELAKADKRRELIEMRAVEDAVVLQVGDISVGSVVESAKKMFVLVPIDGGLQVEAEIGTRDQGFVKVGQQVELKFDAWPYTRHGTARGTVRSISGDAFTHQNAQGGAGPAVYVAHIDIVDRKLREVPADFTLVPGMPLTADIAIGSHTIMGYMLDRALPVMQEGLREP
jgi:HlyD family type I secretion membrane fusion protein